MDEIFANIIVDVSVKSLDKPFIYKIPEELKDIVKPGDKVTFPFGKGNAEREGFVLEFIPNSGRKTSHS